MSERAVSLSQEGRLEEANEFHRQAVRLFKDGLRMFDNPFTNYEAKTDDHHKTGIKGMRYKDRLRPGAIVTLVESGDLQGLLQEQDDSGLLPIPAVTIDTPLPPTSKWPNSYVRETFILPSKDLRTLEMPYDSTLEIAEYTQAGDSLTHRDITALEAELRPPEDSRNLEEKELLENLIYKRLNDLAARKLIEAEKAYPGFMSRFYPERISERFTDALALLIRLSLQDEVGCDPNPYIRQ
jgi:hypothetical protein